MVLWLRSLLRNREEPGSILIGNTIGNREEEHPKFKMLHCSTEAWRQSQQVSGRHIALLAPSNPIHRRNIDVKKDFFYVEYKEIA